MREITFLEAVREALRQEMELDENVFILGEDVGAFGGCFGVTAGLLDQFGTERVMDTPISESGIMGAALGAAAHGASPGTGDSCLSILRPSAWTISPTRRPRSGICAADRWKNSPWWFEPPPGDGFGPRASIPSHWKGGSPRSPDSKWSCPARRATPKACLPRPFGTTTRCSLLSIRYFTGYPDPFRKNRSSFHWARPT